MLRGIKIKDIVISLLLPVFLGASLFYGYNFYIGSETNENQNTNEPNNEQEEEIEEEPPTLKIMDENSNTRPIGFTIDNEYGSWPHGGLQDAYLVYEIIIEGGESRYFALFKDKPDTILGPCRSARHYFLDYALENDAIFTHYGYSPQALSDIKKLDIDNISGTQADGGIFWRELPKGSYHNVFTKISNVMERAKKKKYRVTSDQGPLIAYSITPIDLSTHEDAIVANNISIYYSSYHYIDYEYDPINKVYNRLIRGKTHYDRFTEKQYTVKNIITYQLKNYNIGDGTGRQQLVTVGKGSGYYITEGNAIPITWEKTSRSSRTIYKDVNGEEIILNDGNTFIQIQPNNKKLTIE